MPGDAPIVWSSHPEIFQKPAPREEGPAGLPPKGQAVKVRREKQGRAGKTVTTLFEFQASDAQRAELARQIKHKIGTGGTVKAGVVEIQGDHLDKVLALLNQWGYRAKKAGG